VKTVRTATAIAALALVLAGCVARETPSDQRSGGSDFTPSQTAEQESASASATEGDCGFTAESGKEPIVGLPPDEGPVDAKSLALTTSAGKITIALDAAKAPCTVQSMVFLAGEHFFDNTVCHRLTASEGLKVLQCGDPEGNGSGGPGYVVPDELPTDLAPGPDSGGQRTVIYPRGIAAMANAGPGTTGSQFFLVYGDSTLPPAYTAFGTVDAAGLATLDTIAAAGITPGDNGPEDGSPKTPVMITSAVAG
jgi:peptidyl-prolyl cis-trans isomerase B (cyclophilin B)